jgi:hypothetical protein
MTCNPTCLTSPATSECYDDPDWFNEAGKSCSDLEVAGICTGTGLQQFAVGWLTGEAHHFPERWDAAPFIHAHAHTQLDQSCK